MCIMYKIIPRIKKYIYICQIFVIFIHKSSKTISSGAIYLQSVYIYIDVRYIIIYRHISRKRSNVLLLLILPTSNDIFNLNFIFYFYPIAFYRRPPRRKVVNSDSSAWYPCTCAYTCVRRDNDI